MSKPNYTHLTLILDGSGSMATYVGDVIDSMDAFLTAQDQLDGELTVSINIFDDVTNRYVQHFVDAEHAKSYVSRFYRARGGTALYDAIGGTAREVGSKIVSLREDLQPEKIIFAILTDGKENRSHNFNSANIKEIVDFYEDTYDWEFLFVGANQNAYETGRRFGIKAGKALSYATSQDGIQQAMNAINGAVTRYRQNGAPHANQFFTEDDHAFQAALGASASPVSA